MFFKKQLSYHDLITVFCQIFVSFLLNFVTFLSLFWNWGTNIGIEYRTSYNSQMQIFVRNLSDQAQKCVINYGCSFGWSLFLTLFFDKFLTHFWSWLGHIFRKFQIANHARILRSNFNFLPLKIVFSHFPFPTLFSAFKSRFPREMGFPNPVSRMSKCESGFENYFVRKMWPSM